MEREEEEEELVKKKLRDEKESGKNSSWVDLEPLLLECSLQMRSGELIHQKSFGLFEAMSAVEIMDPKMDCGCVTGGGGFGETDCIGAHGLVFPLPRAGRNSHTDVRESDFMGPGRLLFTVHDHRASPFEFCVERL